ncbi:MAG: hypothetical protein K1X89_21165 [Myxococcaceae bacterium]|nr:hypothetical protein [Myxococcaceae bacterium]
MSELPANLRQAKAGAWVRALIEAGKARPALRVGGVDVEPLWSMRAQLIQLGGEVLSRPVSRLGAAEALRLGAYELRRVAKELTTMPAKDTQGAFALFVPRNSGHMADLLPVIRALQGVEKSSVVFWRGQLHADFRDEVQWVTPSARQVLKALPTAVRLLGWARAVSGAGAHAFPEVEPGSLESVVARVFASHSVDLVTFAAGFQDVVARERPRIVVVGNPFTLEGSVATLVAHASRIPVACVEHGTIFGGGDAYWIDSRVDRILVWGEPSKRALLENGVEASAISVVGAPRLDSVINRAQVTEARTVLVATSGAGDSVSHAEQAAFLEALYATASELTDVQWVVKLHPKDPESAYQAAAARYPRARVSVERGNRSRSGLDIYDYLARAKVMVTITSSAALDAMVARVPVVTWLPRPAAHYAHVEFIARKATTQVTSQSELKSALVSILGGGADAAVLERADQYQAQHYANRGNASQHAATALCALAG